MIAKVVFLLALFCAASSKLPHIRRCDPEPRRQAPTHCSNYQNILHIHGSQTSLQKKQMTLEQRIDAIESKTRLQLQSANSNISALEILATNLSSALKDLERMAVRTEMELDDARRQLDKHGDDISSLKREVRLLGRHRETANGNFSEIEKKLEETETQLSRKKARLENLETATAATFSNTQRLLNRYKDELSHLNTTARELEVKVDARLDATKTEFEARLKKIQNNSDAFSTKLEEQEAKVDEFKRETDGKLRKVDQHLKDQNTTVDQQKAELVTLKTDNAGIKGRLKSTEEKLVEQNQLKEQVARIQTEVDAKVAFSATVIESRGVFTGPSAVSKTLIFNKVFANVGNAYNSTTGVFTAPLKGVYHFSFMTFGYSSHTSGAMLLKNGRYQVSTWEFTGPDESDTTSNTVVLKLSRKETVKIVLWKGGKVHTSVFSGFLVFTT